MNVVLLLAQTTQTRQVTKVRGQTSTITAASHFLQAPASAHTRGVCAPPPLASSCRTKRPRFCNRAHANHTKTRKYTQTHKTHHAPFVPTNSRALAVRAFILERKSVRFTLERTTNFLKLLFLKLLMVYHRAHQNNRSAIIDTENLSNICSSGTDLQM